MTTTQVLDKVEVCQPIRCEHFAVFPLKSSQSGTGDYLLADEAMEQELIDVQEASEEGSVTTIVVVNRATEGVLFIEGESLLGAKQDRVLNATVLVGAGKTCAIPVSCIEYGRWQEVSTKFSSGGHVSPHHLRHRIKKSVAASVAAGHGHQSDQAGVWYDIAQQQRKLRVGSRTGSMSDSWQRYAEEIRRFTLGVAFPGDVQGMAAAVGDSILGVDLFGKSSVCEHAWPRLLGGYALDALLDDSGKANVDVAGVEEFLDEMRKARWQKSQTVGEGEEFRSEVGLQVVASALEWNEGLLHASASAKPKP